MSRETILASIKKLKAEIVPLPNIELDHFSEEIDVIDTFKKNVQLVGGNLIEVEDLKSLDEAIKKLYPNAKKIVAQLPESNLGNITISKETKPHSLENIDLAIIKGEIGIAENGSVWISENQFLVRALPFITNDLVLILSKESLCLNMHNAFEIIANRNRTFGLFIAGPSKTADIEQCLVVGAQGAMSLIVILY